MIGSIEPSLFERMVALRRDLHRHPELSWQEHRTAERLSTELEQLGLSPRRTVETGVVAEIPGLDGSPTVALRADIDALPVAEDTGLPFASQTPGVMHACGHDAHAAMLLGAAELLLGGDRPLPTTVRLLFQPAEEIGAGARAMLEGGVLEGVGAVFGGHVDRHFPTGTIVAADGVVNASTDTFRIAIRGRQGHAARPHEAVDAVVVGSLIVMALQTIVSREIDPASPSVLSIGRFDAGTAANVIAGMAILEGSIRAQDPEVREHLQQSLRRICESLGQLHESSVELEMGEGTPPLINGGPMAEIARNAAVAVLGPDRVRRAVRGANMGGEDFAWYLQRVPGCYVRFGARTADRPVYPAHSSRFEIDERVLETGAAWFAEVARLAGQHLSGGRPLPAGSPGDPSDGSAG